MSAASTTLSRSLKFYEASIGKKVVMAVTGCVLFLFVVGHMLGNLQIYMGPEQLNSYARHLHDLGPLLWVVRGVLLLTVVVHLISAIQLWLMNRAARPSRYVKHGWVEASFASRTMIISGPLLAAFIVYHLLHFTTGQAHPNFAPPRGEEFFVYDNVVNGFSNPLASAAYIVAMIILGYHLIHGVRSMFQSVGINHPLYLPWIKRFATAATFAIVAGNISIPVAVLTGFVR